MRLLFWRKKSQPESVVLQSPPKPIQPQKKPTQQRKPAQQSLNSERVVQKPQLAKEKVEELLPLKTWCDINLNPLAWSRIVIRMLPVFRDFNQDLSTMQRPSHRTVVEYDLYLLIIATIQEIYGVVPNMVTEKIG
jgi:hypothetical protein